ncbi:MAG: hypothetical protein LAO76_22375 [Acidobacteriia bacterium]|nr:hypothetical protein [Terriglobia bacterium]
MAILQQASTDDRKRLLELFPVTNLRHNFQVKGTRATKEEICFAAAGDNSAQQIAKVAKFVDDHLCCCKQHVYVFSQDGPVALPNDVADGEKVLDGGRHALYLSRAKYSVVLRDPLEETTLEFLWPIRIEIHGQYLVLRCVVLEKNVTSYFDERPAYVAGKTLTEKTILAGIGMNQADLNKGIKKLWADGFLESSRSNFKKPFSLSSETMDEAKGIKEHYPEVYAIMQESPLYTTLFQVAEKNSVAEFSADPSHGIIGFGSYSEKGDTDGIIEKIISNN